MIAHAGPVHTSRALPANMVSVLEDYYWSETEDSTMSVSAIIKMGAQKAGKEPKAGVNVPRLQQAVDQSIFDGDEELTPVEDMDELEDTLVSTEVQHMVPSVPQKSQHIPQPRFDAEKSDTISMKVTPFPTQEVFVDFFPQDLESLFLEEDAVCNQGYEYSGV